MTTAIKINANDGVKRNIMVGGETTVDFDFPIYDATHIQIYETNTAGTISLLVKDTDYSVPAGSVNQQAGGTVTLDVGVYPTGATAGHVFTAYQAAPEARTTDFNQAGDFFADTLNRELDLFAQQTQQIRRDLNRALLAPVDTAIASFSLPAPVDGRALIWDGVSGTVTNGPTADEITNAQGYATAAETSKDDAAAILAQVQTLYDNFDDRYLGTKSSDPTLDNDGDALVDGALYYNTTANVMKVYDLGTTTWLVIDTVIADGSVTLAKLADLAQSTIIGRASGAGTGVPTALTAAQVKTILGISSFIETLLDDADAAASRTTLDVYSKAESDALSGVTISTEQTATGSETAFDFTGIPAGVKRITIMFFDLVPNGANDIFVRIGDSGGIETTGYTAGGATVRSGSTGAGSGGTTAFEMDGDSFSNGCSGAMVLTAMDSAGTKWVAHASYNASTSKSGSAGGSKELSGTLDRLRIMMDNGTTVFNSGSVNIAYE